jgi:hypothetical protein
MREKAYTVYEEMIHIPVIVHNPKLFPEPSETDAFCDHLDTAHTARPRGRRSAGILCFGQEHRAGYPRPIKIRSQLQDVFLRRSDDSSAQFPGSNIRATREGLAVPGAQDESVLRRAIAEARQGVRETRAA